ncbi:MAG: AAA family ATPase [Pseudomonadota bacterium]
MAWLVGLSGVPGVGKSTIARAFAGETGALWLRVDHVEQAMRESHIQTDDLADGGYAALQAVAAAALEHGFDVLAHSLNPIQLTQVAWRAATAEKNGRHLDVELSFSDKAAHRQRVEIRASDVPGRALSDWPAVLDRRYEPFTSADLQLDTGALTVAKAAARIRAATAVAEAQSHG